MNRLNELFNIIEGLGYEIEPLLRGYKVIEYKEDRKDFLINKLKEVYDQAYIEYEDEDLESGFVESVKLWSKDWIVVVFIYQNYNEYIISVK